MHAHQVELKGTENIVDESNKDFLPRDSHPRRMVRHLRNCLARQGRIVSRQVWRGATYNLSTNAVSLLIIWFQSRR